MSLIISFLDSLKEIEITELILPESYEGRKLYDDTHIFRVYYYLELDQDFIKIRKNKDGYTVIHIPKELDKIGLVTKIRAAQQKKFIDEIELLVKEYKNDPKRDDTVDRNIIKLIRNYVHRDVRDSYINEYMQTVQICCLKAQNLKF